MFSVCCVLGRWIHLDGIILTDVGGVEFPPSYICLLR